MTARALMVQGTGSDVGKSLMVAGLARHFARQGLTVLPFKPQNMSNNAAVAVGGGEIGRAQALQARAAFAEPSVHMNPVLLKPQSDTGAQVVVQGFKRGVAEAAVYQEMKPDLLGAVMDSFDTLKRDADLVLVEGAGSPAEINLRAGDIANMGFATVADVPVVLVGDIDKGGVIASLVGTAALLSPEERALVCGFICNKFRGDLSLFEGGLAEIEGRTGWRSFGTLPFWPDAGRLPSEDGVILQDRRRGGNGQVHIVVPCLPGISNFDDVDPLRLEPNVRLDFVGPGDVLPGQADVIVLPGTKSTLRDLAFVRAQGWDVDILAHARRGGLVVGLCGGYQMLGRRIFDPEGMDGAAGEAEGLGLLDVETVMAPEKVLRLSDARERATGETVRGYEIHAGQTEGPDCARPMLTWGLTGGLTGGSTWKQGGRDGAVSADGKIMGCYLHGLFAADGYRRAFLSRLSSGAASQLAYEQEVDRVLDGLADHLAAHLDLVALLGCAR